MASVGKKLNTIHSEEHDNVEYRKRVTSALDGNVLSYEVASFASLATIVVLDVYSSLASLRPNSEQYIGHAGYIYNDGTGEMQVEFSSDGTNYGGQHTVKTAEELTFDNLTVKKIRLTRISETSFRILVG